MKRAVKTLGQICVGPTLTDSEIKRVSKELNKRDLSSTINLYQILSGKTRFKILYLLSELKELCVCDLADILKTTVSAVSHQLRILKEADLVKARRESQTIYYSLQDKSLGRFLTR